MAKALSPSATPKYATHRIKPPYLSRLPLPLETGRRGAGYLPSVNTGMLSLIFSGALGIF